MRKRKRDKNTIKNQLSLIDMMWRCLLRGGVIESDSHEVRTVRSVMRLLIKLWNREKKLDDREEKKGRRRKVEQEKLRKEKNVTMSEDTEKMR